jgi:hypothetical protein
LGGRDRQISEFEANLVYKVCSRTARTIQRNPVLEKKTKQNKKKKTKKTKNKKQKPSKYKNLNKTSESILTNGKKKLRH